MLSLKNHFCSEKKKVEASSKKSGSGVSGVSLKDNFTLRPTQTNLKRSFSSRNTEEVQFPPIKRETRVEAIS